MASKRLNLKFLVIFVLFLAIMGLTGFGLLKWNQAKSNESLYSEGMAFYEAGNKAKAMELFGKYYSISRDTERRNEVVRLMAFYQADELEKYGAGNAARIEAIQGVLQRALEAFPRDIELKESMAKAYGKMRKYQRAASLYEELSKEDPDKPDYPLQRAENLIAGSQYNDAGLVLADLVEKHATFIPGYLCYSRFYESNLGQPDVAENILDNMVESNQHSAAAHAYRAIFRLEHNNAEGAAEDVAMAGNLEPDSIDTVIASAMYAVYDKQFKQAHELLDRALELDPNRRGEVNKLMIRLADEEKKPEDAISLLRDEIKQKDDIALRLQLFERLIAMQKIDEAKQEIEYLRKLKMPLEIIGFFESTTDILEGKWRDAARKLELARSALGMHPEMLAFIDRQLALCYGELGQTDKQIEAFNRAIENASEAELIPFYTSYILILNNAGKTEQLEEVIRDLMIKIGEEKFMEIPQLRAIRIALITQREASLPKDQQNWDAINELLESSNMDANDPESVLLGVRLLIKQNKIYEARDLLKRSMLQNPDAMAFPSYLALLEAQEKNYDEALKVLSEAIDKKKMPGLFLTKIRVLIQMGLENAKPHLENLEKEITDLTPDSQTTVQKQLAMAWLHLGDLNNAKRLFMVVSEKEPENIGIKVQMFDLARKADDDKGMDLQMGLIRRAVNQNSAEFLYCQAAKKIWQFTKKKISEQDLELAKDLLSRAKDMRPNWVNIPRAQAEIALLQNDYSSAIDYLYRVDQIGALSVQQLDLLIRLLYHEERDIEVKQLIENKRGAQLATDAAMMTVEAQVNAGDGDEALRRANEIMDPNNPKDFLWKGHIAMRAKDYKEAEDAFRHVTEVMPENPNGWLSLLNVLKAQNKEVSKDDFLAKVKESVPNDKLSLCLAKAYQIFGDAKEAEGAFRQAMSQDPNNLEVLYSISQFYMCTSHPELAVPYLRKMNELIGSDRNINGEMRIQQLAWTRRSLAQVYGKVPDYDRQQQALQLIDENLRMQPDSMEDLKVKASLLANRGNPTDNQAAIDLLENIPSLSAREKFSLAKLYDVQSVSFDSRLMWDKCQVLMRDLTSTNDTNVEYMKSYVEMMLKHTQAIPEIQPYLERLEALAPKDPEVILLTARAMVVGGHTEDAEMKLSEASGVAVSAENEAMMRKVAIQLEQMKKNEISRQIWDNLVAFNAKNITGQLQFLSRTEGISAALATLDKNMLTMEKTEVLDAIPVIFRVSLKPSTKEEIAEAERIAQTVEEQKDSVEYKLFEGQFLDSQGKTRLAIQKYEEILKLPSLTRVQKAYVGNNLAYILAVSGTDVPRAITLVDEAMLVLGNGADFLDTRAVIYLKTGERSRIDQAIQDLKRAIVIRQEPLYYFHLAVAFMKKDNKNSAKISFEIARSLDPYLSQSIPRMETKDYANVLTPLAK
ncbi:MAG: hypothetical protein Q4D98_09895 [Planctomycetia bacterium]|nr:hypothetical protein [Planctomycetia bacterium]